MSKQRVTRCNILVIAEDFIKEHSTWSFLPLQSQSGQNSHCCGAAQKQMSLGRSKVMKREKMQTIVTELKRKKERKKEMKRVAPPLFEWN